MSDQSRSLHNTRLLRTETSAYNGAQGRIHTFDFVLGRDAIQTDADAMKKILLVDTEPVSTSGLQRTLAGFEFNVEVADTPEAAQAALASSPFDLILVDFDLSKAKELGAPAISGTGLVRDLRAADVKIPILMYTALEAEWYETAALDAGLVTKVGRTEAFRQMRKPDRPLFYVGHHRFEQYNRLAVTNAGLPLCFQAAD